MLGRDTASHTASASLPSFLPLLRYGATNFGAMSFTVQREHVLCQVDTYGSNLFHDLPSGYLD